MPEYSSTTLTPSDSTKVPAMQNNTSGNFQLDALKAYILTSKGQANGLASLGADGKLTSSQIPSDLDDVLVYGSYSSLPTTGESGKLYIVSDTKKFYYWNGTAYEIPTYVPKEDIVDDLSSSDATKVLSAKQGKALNDSKSNRPSSPVAGNVPKLDANGDLVNSGIPADNVAQQDGYYEGMTAGNAEQLIASVFEQDKTPYNFRTSGGSVNIGDREYKRSTVGGTIMWNQLADIVSTDEAHYLENWNSTIVRSGNQAVITSSGDGPKMVAPFRNTEVKLIKNHKYLISCNIKASSYTPTDVEMHLFSAWIDISSVLNIAWSGYKTYSGIVNVTDTSTSFYSRFAIFINGNVEGGSTVIIADPVWIDLTLMFGSQIADYIYTLESGTAGAGVAWFRKLFPKPYYAYNAGTLESVCVSEHNSIGFNQWDEEWEVGTIDLTTGENFPYENYYRSKNYIPVIGGVSYYLLTGSNIVYFFFYDSNKNYLNNGIVGNDSYILPNNVAYIRFVNTSTNQYNHDICINLHWDGERDGEYEPYKKNNYPLDHSKVLRGIPKLDASNNLYFDGDVYEPDGKVTRRYGIVDLSTLNWSYVPSSTVFTSPGIPSAKFTRGESWGISNSKYLNAGYVASAEMGNNTYEVLNNGEIWIKDTSYTDPDLFKIALSGNYLVYELATPTEDETPATPYTELEIVDDFGTEEFVDYPESQGTRDVAIPVGHVTDYQPNLRAKVEMMPNNPSGDGKYLLQMDNGSASYVAYIDPIPAFQEDIEDGTVIAKKAECDASGNTITTTYATKTELGAEETARSAGDSLLSNRIISNSQRIANIEDKSEPFTIEYPSSDYGKGTVPASIEKSGMVTEVKGRTRAIAQLYDISSQGIIDSSGISLTVGTTSLTINGTASSAIYKQTPSTFKFISGHTYLFVMAGWSETKCYLSDQSGLNVFGASTRIHQSVVLTASASGGDLRITIPNGSAFTNVKMTLNCFDLTLTLPEYTSAQIVSLGVSGVLSLLPDLGKYTPYGYSLSSTIVSGMRSVGVNIFDEVMESGGIDGSTGENTENSSIIRSKNYTKVSPNTAYYFRIGTSETCKIIWYDANKNFISSVSNTSGANTSPANACYVRFQLYGSYGTTYLNDIQICLNSYPQKTVYHPYKSSEITFSEPVTLRSAGSVRDELIPEEGKVEKPVKEIDLTDKVFTYNSSIQRFYCMLSDGKAVSSPAYSNPNAVCTAYVNANDASKSYSVISNMQFVFADRSFNSIPFFIFRDDSHDGSSLDSSGHAPWLSGHKLAYELAEEVTETISPSPTALEVEPYGEVSLIQDQDIQLDGGFSMRYIPDSPYVKKADIVNNLSSSDTDKPLSANMGRVIGQTLDQHDSRIRNLEQKAGDYVPVNYRGTNAVPTGKASYGLVEKIVGKTRAWNSLYDKKSATTTTANGIDFKVNSDGTITVGGSSAQTATGLIIFKCNVSSLSNYGLNHKILVLGCPSGGSSSTYYLGGMNSGDGRFDDKDTGGGTIISVGSTYGLKQIIINIESGTTINSAITFRPIVRDLTLIFGSGNEPATVADALTALPALGQYNAYNAGTLVSTTLDGVESISRNLVTGTYVNETSNPYSTVLRAEFDIKPSTQYTLSFVGANGNIVYVNDNIDSSYHQITCTGARQSVTFTTKATIPSNEHNENGWSILKNHSNNTVVASFSDVQIELGSSASEYYPHVLDTLSLPSVTLRSDGSYPDVVQVDSGNIDRNCIEIDLTTFVQSGNLWLGSNNTAYPYGVGNAIFVCSNPNYVGGNWNSIGSVNNEIAVSPTGMIALCLLDTSESPTGKIVIRRYEPTTESVSPVPNNTILTEGGGTINTIQTQSPVIDNCLDVGYLAV